MNGKQAKFLRKHAALKVTTTPGLVVHSEHIKLFNTGEVNTGGKPSYRRFLVHTLKNNPGSFRSVLKQLKRFYADRKHGLVNRAPAFNDSPGTATT